MNNRTLIIIGSIAALGIGGFIAWRVYKGKQVGTAPVPTNSSANGNNSTLPGTLSEWENTIGGLFGHVSGFFSGNSTSNTNNAAPGAGVTTTTNDLSDWLS